tara:strand:- start:108 stop:458 length:351 start_codon:yes stop_codon:yes gene_type:complete
LKEGGKNMGDAHHQSTSLLKDVYFLNFVVLMVFTIIEVGAVGFEMPPTATALVLISVGVIKGIGIAALFMHLKDDPISLTVTAIFPIFFIIVLFIGIGFTSPAATSTLPAWCRFGT